MKIAFLFIATLAAAVTMRALFIGSAHAAEPVDVYVVPVPASSPGTSAAILPPGTYFAERPNGIRLSGWVHAPDTNRFPMLKKAPSLPPKTKMPQRDPQLRFVPVDTGAGSVTNR